jgi:hypothetical protein
MLSLSSCRPRRFPPPWTINEHNDACFIVKDASGQAVCAENLIRVDGVNESPKLAQ